MTTRAISIARGKKIIPAMKAKINATIVNIMVTIVRMTNKMKAMMVPTMKRIVASIDPTIAAMINIMIPIIMLMTYKTLRGISVQNRYTVSHGQQQQHRHGSRHTPSGHVTNAKGSVKNTFMTRGGT